VELLEQRSCFAIPFTKLPGGEFKSEEELFDELKEMNAHLHLSDLKYFVGRYGKSALPLMRLTLKNKELKRRVEADEPWILAEVVYCARYEMVMTLNDFLWRRARWARFKNLSPKTVELVAKYLAQELRWSTKRLQAELQSYQAEFTKTQITLNH
jgi:glycerol-3-phosphate dehydrogenase